MDVVWSLSLIFIPPQTASLQNLQTFIFLRPLLNHVLSNLIPFSIPCWFKSQTSKLSSSCLFRSPASSFITLLSYFPLILSSCPYFSPFHLHPSIQNVSPVPSNWIGWEWEATLFVCLMNHPRCILSLTQWQSHRNSEQDEAGRVNRRMHGQCKYIPMNIGYNKVSPCLPAFLPIILSSLPSQAIIDFAVAMLMFLGEKKKISISFTVYKYHWAHMYNNA